MNYCQYTGAELKNSRAKNSQEVTALLNQAYKVGRYGDVVSAMAAAMAEGKTGAAVLATGQHALKHGFSVSRQYEIDGEIDGAEYGRY